MARTGRERDAALLRELRNLIELARTAMLEANAGGAQLGEYDVEARLAGARSLVARLEQATTKD